MKAYNFLSHMGMLKSIGKRLAVAILRWLIRAGAFFFGTVLPLAWHFTSAIKSLPDLTKSSANVPFDLSFNVVRAGVLGFFPRVHMLLPKF